ncbi:MAG TPA: Hpt domain-containing protein [Oligoflexus sp.]|uniref:Hpt domain-containing protein n=1 Tax=Oligoflexus sp. TaxID=1971216 RepID=UPI002D66A6D2|nr:Hpt domain-containing protein [Oligoflexus sp.]HYX33531.1 Hpt domain-containing protein [Oligoflexus sp.]
MNNMSQAQQSSEPSEEQDIELTSSQDILNDSLLAQYEAMDEGITDDPLLPKLFSIFQKNITDHLKKLAVALQKHDETEVNYLIHKMLGMAHNVGALRLSDVLMILEQAETSTKMRLDGHHLAILNAEYKAAEAALIQHMNSRSH